MPREAHVEGQIHHILQEFVETGEKPNRRISFSDHRTTGPGFLGKNVEVRVPVLFRRTFKRAGFIVPRWQKLGYVHAYIYMYIYIDIYKFVQVPSSIILAWKDFFVFSLKVGDHVSFDYYYHTITMVIKTQGMNCCSWCKVTSASFLSN